MMQRGWIRACVLWAAPLLLAVVVVVWAWSKSNVKVLWGPWSTFLDVERGRMHAGLLTAIDPGERMRDVQRYRAKEQWSEIKTDWSFECHWNYGYKWIAIPLWFPAGLLLIAAGLGWRNEMASRRRSHTGLCARCGYSREGIAGNAACPECGIG